MSRFPHRRPPGVLGRAVPAGPPVRPPHPQRQEEPRRQLAARGARPGRHRHVRTTTFLGERYGRIARRRGKAKAQVAIPRSILTIIWHLLADPATRYTDLGYGYYQAPHRQRPQGQEPHPADRSAAGPPHHHHAQGRLTLPVPDQARSPRQARVRCRAPIYAG